MTLQTNLATLLVFDEVNIERGYFTTKGCINDNQNRIKNARRQNTESSKVRRRYLRGLRKSKCDKTKKVEGKVYGAGKFEAVTRSEINGYLYSHQPDETFCGFCLYQIEVKTTQNVLMYDLTL